MTHRLFRRLLRLLPADFQADYARDMERTFDLQHREAAERGLRGLLALWWETVRDLARTAPREHFDQLVQDVGYALRAMRRRPGATLAAVATLAVGIGGVTAITSVVNGVDWRPLAYRDPDRVVFVQERYGGEFNETTGYTTFADWRERTRSFEAIAAAGYTTATLSGPEGDAEQVNGMRVTPGFFRVIGVEPMLGRGFTEAENRWDNRRHVILSERLWRRRFGADPGVVGRAVQLGGRPYVVAGVMRGAEELIGERLFDGAEVLLPLGYDISLPFACRTCRHIRVFARLRGGVTVEQATAEIDAVTRRIASDHPTSYSEPGARVVRAADALLGPVRPALYVLLAAVVVLLLIAGVNVANLLLARAVERAPEVATRRALGVASSRLVRQLLTESLVLAALGAGAGLLVGWAAIQGLIAVAPASVPRIAEVSLDLRVLALTAAAAAIVGVLFGMLPAWQLVSSDVAATLRGGRTTIPGSRAGRVLIAANVALAVLLLAAAGLLGRSLVHLLQVDPGFDPDGVVTATVSPAGEAYAESAALHAFYRNILDRTAGPGDIAAFTSQLPIDPDDSAGFHVEGRTAANPEDAPSADRFAVSPAYFQALRIPVLRGRVFTDQDGADAPRVAVINQTAARQLFGGEDPLGRWIVLGGPDGPKHTIVGIVGDVRHHGLDEPVSYQAYIPLPQFYDSPARLVLRTDDPLAEAVGRIRQAVAALDRSQAVQEIRPFPAIVGETLAERRFLLWLIAGFAAAALLLAGIGLYGVVSYVVAQRTRDIGLRLALGAARSDIRRLVLRIGMTPVIAGLAFGLTLVVLAMRPVEGMLFEVEPLDPWTLAAAAAVLVGSALLACYLPARRAVRVDPLTALRAE